MKEKILIAPLDWGLGHATRSVPVINQYLEAGHEVVLAASGRSASFLRQYYPDLQLLDDIPSYGITYQGNGSFLFQIARQVPHILKTIRMENAWLRKTIDREKIQCVISDNRYGLYSERIPCHFITHQLFIKGPRLVSPLARNFVRQCVSRFSKCWVPDFEGDKNLTGELSHGKLFSENISYIGPLSRFAAVPKIHDSTDGPNSYVFIAIISGPEPQRTLLEVCLEKIFIQLGKPALIICGQPELSLKNQQGLIHKVPHLNDQELACAVRNSKMIVCRSGYSTLMDLHALSRKALLIPTPGQTEQEYLAQHFGSKFGFAACEQKKLSHHLFQTLFNSGTLDNEFKI